MPATASTCAGNNIRALSVCLAIDLSGFRGCSKGRYIATGRREGSCAATTSVAGEVRFALRSLCCRASSLPSRHGSVHGSASVHWRVRGEQSHTNFPPIAPTHAAFPACLKPQAPCVARQPPWLSHARCWWQLLHFYQGPRVGKHHPARMSATCPTCATPTSPSSRCSTPIRQGPNKRPDKGSQQPHVKHLPEQNSRGTQSAQLLHVHQPLPAFSPAHRPWPTTVSVLVSTPHALERRSPTLLSKCDLFRGGLSVAFVCWKDAPLTANLHRV